ncbi:DUF6090 family protein [Polaribacter glomeratus]|uniref:Uncharacterized protein n=1 Tax=Polaribacter glomeratus TaxID=102 RepID=A0A2S7WI67_9FLAO|nr:DUF6090 family protein [Polaribacter glomeratus]PQJ77305.1 hypothetical protein BTO16_15830 [Polaribacter glomeratus]TXD65889.1 hypothetical protein ESX12_06935 [Polaribacter glomeratus]
MIKFFRKIRQKLLIENKFNKYLLYAFGEIFLVVIGILIALQIGIWTKARQTDKLELKIQKEIKGNLKNDLNVLQLVIQVMQEVDTACTFLKTSIEHKKNLSKGFLKNAALLRITPHFDPNKSGYDLLVSKGIEIISNDSLRNAISTNYERLYPYYRRYEDERLLFHTNHSGSRLIEYFNLEFSRDFDFHIKAHITSKDYERMLADASFYKLLSAIKCENKAVIDRAMRVEKSIISLIAFLENEIATTK